MAKKTVKFFDYSRIYQDDAQEIERIIKEIGLKGQYILQEDLKIQ